MNTTKLMKAAVRYWDGKKNIVRIENVSVPSPKKHQVLIKVHTSSVNAVDWRMLGFKSRKKIILGADVAGEVVAVGGSVSQWKIGDRVNGCLADAGLSCFAEYVCADESLLARMPQGVLYETAAAVPMTAVVALQAIRDKGNLRRGQKVLINGASGGIGTFAIQIAKYYGAEVSGTCTGEAIKIAKSLGIDHTIDYTKEDFRTMGEKYDLIIDIVANCSVDDYRKVLKRSGRCVVVGFSNMWHMFGIVLSRKKDGKKIIQLLANNKRQDDLRFVNELVEAEKIKPVIAGKYPLKAAAQAIDFVKCSHPTGKIVVDVIDG